MKITSLAIILSILITCFTYAKEPTGTPIKQISKLKKELQTVKEDTIRIRLLNDLAFAYFQNTDYQNTKKSARNATELADNLLKTKMVSQNPSYIKKCKMLKAKALENLGNALYFEDINSAFTTFQAALNLWQETGNKAGIASTLSDIAEIKSARGENAQALEDYRTSLNIYEELSKTEETGIIWFKMGLLHRYMSNYGDALESNIKALKIGKKIKDTTLITDALLANGFNYMLVRQFPEAIKNQQEALRIFVARKDSTGIAFAYNDLGVTDLFAEKLDDALKNHSAALAIRKKLKDDININNSYGYIATTLKRKGKYIQALNNSMEALKYAKKGGDIRFVLDAFMINGEIYLELKEYENAKKSYDSVLHINKGLKNSNYQSLALNGIGEVLLKMGKTDNAIHWFLEAENAVSAKDYKAKRMIYRNISEAYLLKNDYKNAYKSRLKYEFTNDSLAAAEKADKITNLTQQLIFENKRALQKASQDKQLSLQKSEIKRQKIVRNISIAILILAILLAFAIFKRFKEKRKLTVALQKSLHDLRSTQKQLIQSEKMASLGELTAGIAHEIQNPLNFVNNFSEVSNELLTEMEEEIQNGNYDEAKELLNDIKQNLQKIKHHGKRAEGIVKGMLQHSRKSTEEKEPTDINKLADEYLRLAYHGLRAKDKSFNATLETDFDESIGLVNIIPQDMGRVILNLITNAFYACTERSRSATNLKKSTYHNASEAEEYKPTVSVSTKMLEKHLGVGGEHKGKYIEISIKDNGNGISKHVLDKIFQPFFTTKPTGEGTGLGLSMSYDIVTKGHSGNLKVETEEGKGTTFIINIPK